MKLMVEARYHRVPKKHDYTGEIVIAEHGAPNTLHLPFEEVDMAEIATDLHHAVRLAMSRAEEVAVRIVQSNPTIGKAVPMDLPHDQINRIYQSPGESRRFFNCE